MKYSDALSYARQMRQHPTAAELFMWERVRRKQINGIKFYRQYIIEHADILGVKAFFIADFYCHPQKLIIEIDGNIHLTSEQMKYDKERSEVLREMGYRIIRLLIKRCSKTGKR